MESFNTFAYKSGQNWPIHHLPRGYLEPLYINFCKMSYMVMQINIDVFNYGVFPPGLARNVMEFIVCISY